MFLVANLTGSFPIDDVLPSLHTPVEPAQEATVLDGAHPAPSDGRAAIEVSMIVIGDEILGGYVTDQNSPWLAKQLQSHGVPLTWVHVVPDDLGAIDEAIQTELARPRPRLILTSGGIGSTPDDITFEAVAASLGLNVVEHAGLSARLDGIVDRTRELGYDVNDDFIWHLKRMARIPEGSRLLQHRDSWVPAIAIDVEGGSNVEGATVVILPGVPAEFRRLLREVVEPTLIAGRNPIPTVVEIEHAYPESVLNLTFVELEDRYPNVQLGSYPGDPMIVRLTGPAEEVAGAEALVREALERLDATPAGVRLAAAWSRRTHPVIQEDA